MTSTSGYYPSPWPGEDGGSERLQMPRSGAGLNLGRGDALGCVSRKILHGTMTILGDAGEVFLLTHSALRSYLGMPTTSCVERVDPITLETIDRSPRLPGGPMWPGGMAVHRNGSLYVVYGRYIHRLTRACTLLQSYQLPVARPYNSFVILDNGLIVTKALSDTERATLSVIDPESMTPVCTPLGCPEPSIARLSSTGNTVYMVGVKSIFRFDWHEPTRTLVLDPGWRFNYVGTTTQTYGWDVVLDGTHAWFMDNGKHSYQIKMIGNGVNPTPNHLIRVSMTDASDAQIVPVCGVNGGSITNPPLYDVKRRLAIGYDAANRHLRAWRLEPDSRDLTPVWERSEFGCASHMILYPDTGELVVNDYRKHGEEVVILRIETGDEIARVRVGGISQGVVFPSTGWNRDLYWVTFGRLARIFVK